MLRQIRWWVGVLVGVSTGMLALIPQSYAQITEMEFLEGRARTACRNQATQQGLTVNHVVLTMPISNSNGQMVGAEVIMNVSRSGSAAYDVRCNFDSGFETAIISNLPTSESAPSPTEGTFDGRGLAMGSVFGREQVADAQLNVNGRNFSFSLAVPPGTGAQLNYIGTVNRIRQAGSSRANNGFILQGRVRSLASSASNMQVTNVAGDCQIEVFDARVISSSCNTRLRDTASRFEGLHQF